MKEERRSSLCEILKFYTALDFSGAEEPGGKAKKVQAFSGDIIT